MYAGLGYQALGLIPNRFGRRYVCKVSSFRVRISLIRSEFTIFAVDGDAVEVSIKGICVRIVLDSGYCGWEYFVSGMVATF
jgi:hypothetical protein